MSALSSYRSLVIPDLTDLAGDTIADLATNFGILDLSSAIPCTSATRPTPVAGMVIFETDTVKLLVYTSSWETVWQSGWTSYTPTWTSTGTAPVKNNGTLVGSYRQAGKTVHVRIHLTMGSSTTFGTGSYSLSLPVAPKTGLRQTIGGAVIGSGTAWYAIVGWTDLAAGTSIVRMAHNNGAVGTTSPVTFASTNEIVLNGTYEAN